MDVVLIHIPIFLGTLALTILLWIFFAGSEQDEESRLRKKVGVFLIWFLINWIFILSQMMRPVWDEPDPIDPGLQMIQFNLPFFIIFSIPFIIDIIYQSRKIAND